MAKYGSNSVVVEFDTSAGGSSLTDMSQYVTEFNGMDIEAAFQESHAFGDSWREHLATGLRFLSEIVLGGFFDDAATTGPDAIFNAPASGPSVTMRTLKITWGGTKTTSVECFIKKYRRAPVRGELTKFEVTLIPTGAATET